MSASSEQPAKNRVSQVLAQGEDVVKEVDPTLLQLLPLLLQMRRQLVAKLVQQL